MLSTSTIHDYLISLTSQPKYMRNFAPMAPIFFEYFGLKSAIKSRILSAISKIFAPAAQQNHLISDPSGVYVWYSSQRPWRTQRTF